MDQKKLHNLTYNFLRGHLDQEKEQELLNWIALDDQNRKMFLQEQERVKNEVLHRKDRTLDGPWKSMLQRINSRSKKPVILLFNRLWPVAAAFILGALLTVAFVTQVQQDYTGTVPMQHVSTPRGARTNLTLPDGSKVWLNAGTTLSYASVFGKNREVSLQGEAYFEVQKSEKPFMVSTEKGAVRVTGTSFNVKAYPEEDWFETTLVEGSLVVNNPKTGREGFLNPGQQAVMEKGSLQIRNVETRLFTSWKDGKLIFSKEPFPAFIDKLERWYNVKIVYNDPGLDELWYTGTIEMETISEVMEMISKAAPVRYSFDSKTRIFTIKSRQI